MDFHSLSDLSIESRRQLAGVSTSTVSKGTLAQLITQHAFIQKKGIYVPVSPFVELPGKAPVYSEKLASGPVSLSHYQFFSNPLLISRDYSANDHNAQLEAPSLRLTNGRAPSPGPRRRRCSPWAIIHMPEPWGEGPGRDIHRGYPYRNKVAGVWLPVSYLTSLLLVGAFLAALVSPALAITRLPSEFLGKWCQIQYDTGGEVYQMGTCPKGEGGKMIVVPSGTYKGGSFCRLLAIAKSKKGNYLTVFRCYYTKGENLTLEIWWSFWDHGKLLRLDYIVDKDWHPMDK
jgi:hypothetical protein